MDQPTVTRRDAIQPDIWVLVEADGDRTLFRLVEVEDAREAERLISDRQLPVVRVDVALPVPEQLGPTLRALPGRGRLVVVNVQTRSGTNEATLTVPRPATTNMDTHPRVLWHLHGQDSDAGELPVN